MNSRIQFGLIALLLSPAPHAGDLANVITDLYGADGIELSVAAPAGVFHVAHFTADSLDALADLNNAVTGGVGFSAFNSTVTGITFDLEAGVPVASNDSLGPLLSERAGTLGKGKLNVAFSYSNIGFDTFEGTDLDSLTINFEHDDCCGGPGGFLTPDGGLGTAPGTIFELDVVSAAINLQLDQEVFAFFANYGLAENWDVGVVVPIVRVEARATASALVTDITGFDIHSFAGAPDLADSETGGEETGIGDVILRTKYNFLQNHASLPDMAVLAQITLPTGDEDNLLGTGETKFRGLFIASKKFGRFTPHVNVGYEVTTGVDSEDSLSYALGFDARAHQTVTLAFDVLGRYNPDLEVTGNHFIDLAFAAKWNPFGQHNAPISGYVIIPANNEGLRSDAVWGLGVEYTFN